MNPQCRCRFRSPCYWKPGAGLPPDSTCWARLRQYAHGDSHNELVAGSWTELTASLGAVGFLRAFLVLEIRTLAGPGA